MLIWGARLFVSRSDSNASEPELKQALKIMFLSRSSEELKTIRQDVCGITASKQYFPVHFSATWGVLSSTLGATEKCSWCSPRSWQLSVLGAEACDRSGSNHRPASNPQTRHCRGLVWPSEYLFGASSPTGLYRCQTESL